MSMFWHYAPWAHLSAMVESGALRGGNAGADGERPMLWFSANQEWEPTATKLFNNAGRLVQMTFKQQAERFGCIRFGIAATDPRLLNWKNACTAAGTPPKVRRGLEEIGRKKGANPAHWFATTETVPLHELHFQVWLENNWHNAESSQEMAAVWVDFQKRQAFSAA